MNEKKRAKKTAKLEKIYNGKVYWFGKKCFLGMPLSFTKYIVMEDKLITRVGFFNVKEDEVELYKITDKRIEFPLGQRMCGCGTITLISTDKDTPQKLLRKIKNPREAKQIIDKLVTEQRDKYMIRGRDMVGANMTSHVGENMIDLDGDGIPD